MLSDLSMIPRLPRRELTNSPIPRLPAALHRVIFRLFLDSRCLCEHLLEPIRRYESHHASNQFEKAELRPPGRRGSRSPQIHHPRPSASSCIARVSRSSPRNSQLLYLVFKNKRNLVTAAWVRHTRDKTKVKNTTGLHKPLPSAHQTQTMRPPPPRKPQVPYTREGSTVATWMPVSQCLQQSRIIMVGRFIDEEYANQVHYGAVRCGMVRTRSCKQATSPPPKPWILRLSFLHV